MTSEERTDRSRVMVWCAIATGALVVAALAWSFSRQLLLARQMRQDEARLLTVVEAERERNRALVERLEYVRSDEYVEYWARVHARMTRPGEVAVIPVGWEGSELTTGETAAPSAAPALKPFWTEVWEFLFGPVTNPARNP